MSAPPALRGVEHRYVDVPTGVRLHVAEAGPAGAPPVLAVHGWPQHWWLWRGVIGPLSRAFRVLAVDLRGFGWSSPAPDGDYRKDRLVDDLLALLDAEGIDRVRWLGHDWGGYTGFLAAARAPERVERLLVCNIAPPWAAATAVAPNVWRFGYQPLLGAPVLGPALQRDGRLVRAMLAPLDPADRAIFADNLAEPARAAAGSALYRQFVLQEVPALLRSGPDPRRLTMPVKVIHGAADPVVRPEMYRGLPYEVELVPGAGHFVVDERPELVADRALAFFGARRSG